MLHRPHQLTALFLALALLAAACGSSGSSDSDPGAEASSAVSESSEPGSDVSAGESTDPADGGAETSADGEASEPGSGDAASDVASLDTLDGEALAAAQSAVVGEIIETAFQCTEAEGTPTASFRGVTEETITIRYIEADLSLLVPLGLSVQLGTSGLNQGAFYERINACGGINGRMVDFDHYIYDVADIENGRQTCTKATVEDESFLVISRVFIQDLPLCVTETNDTLLFMNTAGSREFYDRSNGLYLANSSPEDVSAAAAIDLFQREGLLTGDTVLGLVWGDVIDQNVLVDGFMRDALTGAVGTLVETPITQASALSCEGYSTAVQQMVSAGVDTVFGIFGGPCYGDFVAEATAQGFFPQYLTMDKSGMTSNIGTAKMPASGDAFEGAVGATMSPGLLGTQDLSESPYQWDVFCNEVVAEVLGVTLEPLTDEYGALVNECSAAYAIITALQNAGADLTQESFIAAINQVDAVPAGGDVVFTGFDDGLGHSGKDVAYRIEWTQSCGCWATVAPPQHVDVSNIG